MQLQAMGQWSFGLWKAKLVYLLAHFQDLSAACPQDVAIDGARRQPWIPLPSFLSRPDLHDLLGNLLIRASHSWPIPSPGGGGGGGGGLQIRLGPF